LAAHLEEEMVVVVLLPKLKQSQHKRRLALFDGCFHVDTKINKINYKKKEIKLQ
jgi:hypothetical protein